MSPSKPLIQDEDFTLHVGDALETLRGLPSESVHMCVTSPPYWGLRNYDVEGQLGLEPTPEEYVARMVEVFREVRRVLRRDGTLWLNLGDSYGAGGGAQVIQTKNASHGLEGMRGAKTIGSKQLAGMPWRLAFALQADGWYLRSDIIWSKPNPMPESVTDRPTKAHEYLFLLSKSPRYFYDADAIREDAAWERWGDQTNAKHEGSGSAAGWIGDRPKRELVKNRTVRPGIDTNGGGQGTGQIVLREGQGRNKRSVWEIATQPYPDAHFATFPQALVEPCILAGSSERGCCPECGAPWEREAERFPNNDGYPNGPGGDQRNHVPGQEPHHGSLSDVARWASKTTGWRPSCGCIPLVGERIVLVTASTVRAAPVPCTVLDPFLGSGTTALVARRLGRKTIGIELSPEYAELAARRLQQLSLLA